LPWLLHRWPVCERFFHKFPIRARLAGFGTLLRGLYRSFFSDSAKSRLCSSPDIVAKPIDFTAKSIDFTAKSIYFVAKSIHFAAKSIDFAAKSIDFVAKSIDFVAKSIDFTTM
jgi:hypothetical protein